MHSLRVVLPLLMAGALTLWSEDAKQTEAQQDGLSGPVRSVSMRAQQSRPMLDAGEARAVQYAPSGDFEYDQQGYRTKYGQPSGPDGQFQGMAVDIARDGNGRAIERTIRLVPTGDVIEHDVYGPFGIVEATSFNNGKTSGTRRVIYDSLGNVLDEATLEGDGKPISRTKYRRNPDGQWTERTMWIQGVLHSHETYDPDTDLQHYEEYNPAGAVVVAFIHHNNRVESYWTASDDPHARTPIFDKLNDSDSRTFSCGKGGDCGDGITRHAVYLDKARHNPSMTEIRADDGRVLCRAWYEYQMDEHENWTSRKIWLQEGEMAERVLYETDSRTITYWPE